MSPRERWRSRAQAVIASTSWSRVTRSCCSARTPQSRLRSAKGVDIGRLPRVKSPDSVTGRIGNARTAAAASGRPGLLQLLQQFRRRLAGALALRVLGAAEEPALAAVP